MVQDVVLISLLEQSHGSSSHVRRRAAKMLIDTIKNDHGAKRLDEACKTEPPLGEELQALASEHGLTHLLEP